MALADAEHQPGDGGMQVKMLMGVDMVEGKARCREGGELRLDLGFELTAHLGAEEEVDAGPNHVLAEEALGVDEIRHPLGRQHGAAFHQHQMKADAQARHMPGPRHRVGRGGLCRHQARRRQDAVAKRLLDGLVDLGRQPEIIGRNDEMLQLASSLRSLRKWKNSTPSRRRRFIICGLRTISPTMEAILPERK